MATTTTLASMSQRVLEDPLAYLPCSVTQEFRKGLSVYSQGQPSTGIYLVMAGKVKLYRTSEAGGRQVLMDIYQTDEFFGEAALIGAPHTETAVALEKVQVMSWTTQDIERLAADRPKLALALLQLQVQRSADFCHRLESLAVDNIHRRLARTLLRFSERLGHPIQGGAVQMIPLTHEMLAQYVGTSREIVTHYMNQFRRDGYVRYSRKSTQLQADALKIWLNQELAAVTERCADSSEASPEAEDCSEGSGTGYDASSNHVADVQIPIPALSYSSSGASSLG
jgi:CRP/FNR family cyclic AMP-dependent transcriptional regulator